MAKTALITKIKGIKRPQPQNFFAKCQGHKEPDYLLIVNTGSVELALPIIDDAVRELHAELNKLLER